MGRVWAEVFGVDAGAADAGEPEVEGLGVVRGDGGGGAEFGARIGGVEFAEGGVPIGVEVGRPGIAAGVGEEFGERKIDERHGARDERV
jgi:hypothetical protein